MVAYFVGKHILSKHHSCLRSNIHVSSGIGNTQNSTEFLVQIGQQGKTQSQSKLPCSNSEKQDSRSKDYRRRNTAKEKGQGEKAEK